MNSGKHQLAVGTRYADGGSVGDWSVGRQKISKFATSLSRLITRTPLSDPMSGFFCISRAALLTAAPRIAGIGYKVFLDIVASSPQLIEICEIPYEFRNRESGVSKLDSVVILEYVELIFEKLFGDLIPVRFIFFCIVGSLGILVHLLALDLILLLPSSTFSFAQSVALIAAMTFNFVLNNRLTYRDRRLKGADFFRGLAIFYIVCSIGAFANVGIGAMLYEGRGDSWWVAGAAGALVGTVWNYTLGSLVTWRKPR